MDTDANQIKLVRLATSANTLGQPSSMMETINTPVNSPVAALRNPSPTVHFGSVADCKPAILKPRISTPHVTISAVNRTRVR